MDGRDTHVEDVGKALGQGWLGRVLGMGPERSGSSGSLMQSYAVRCRRRELCRDLCRDLCRVGVRLPAGARGASWRRGQRRQSDQPCPASFCLLLRNQPAPNTHTLEHHTALHHSSSWGTHKRRDHAHEFIACNAAGGEGGPSGDSGRGPASGTDTRTVSRPAEIRRK